MSPLGFSNTSLLSLCSLNQLPHGFKLQGDQSLSQILSQTISQLLNHMFLCQHIVWGEQ
jgi:hypothetical protein